MSYHLPLSVRWLQSGSLDIPASKAWEFSLPGNAEIGMMVGLGVGSESGAAMPNWIALAVLALAVYLLALRLTRGNATSAITVVFLTMSVPIVEFQTFSGYVDMFGTAFLAAAFALLVDAFAAKIILSTAGEPDRSSSWSLFFSALACGISVGTKPIFYIYSLTYGVTALAIILRRLSQMRQRIFSIVILACGIFLPSVFWFGRALHKTHNPVYPIRVRVGDHVIFDGYDPAEITSPTFDRNFVRSEDEWFLYPWTEWVRDPGFLLIPYGEGSGLGAAFATFVPLSLAWLAFLALRRDSGKAPPIHLFAFSVGILLWWTVLRRVPRFGLPLIVFSCILAAPLLSSLSSTRGFKILLTTSLMATFAISTFVPFHGLLSRIRTRHRSRADFYGYPALIDKLPSGSCLFNHAQVREDNYALLGRALTNQVLSNFELPAKVDANLLRQKGIDYIVERSSKDSLAAESFDGAPAEDAITVRKGEGTSVWHIWRLKRHIEQSSRGCVLN